MRVSIDTAIHFSLVSPEDGIRLAREAGYDSVELGFRPGVEMSTYQGWLRQYGVTVDTVSFGAQICNPDEATRQDAVVKARQLFQSGIELGCRHFISELNGKPGSAESRASFRRSMTDLLPTMEREGLHMSFECHPGDFIEDSNATVDMLREVDSPHVGYLFCAPHTFTMGGDVGGMARYAGRTISHVHIADTFKEERIIKDPPNLGVRTHLHLQPGLGEVDFATFFEALREIGYDGTLAVVAFSHRFDRAFETARATREWLRQNIA